MTDNDELAARFDRVLTALRAVIATETSLDPAWEESMNGVVGAYADAAVSLGQARIAFENETPTMDALVINMKDNRYKDPSWPADGADDAQTLRTVWHFIHDTIVAGKPFAPDVLSDMRNLYAALERAREILTESQPPAAKSSEAKFQWKPPMLEGYVRDLLKEIEYPTEREATEWIAAKSGKIETDGDDAQSTDINQSSSDEETTQTAMPEKLPPPNETETEAKRIEERARSIMSEHGISRERPVTPVQQSGFILKAWCDGGLTAQKARDKWHEEYPHHRLPGKNKTKQANNVTSRIGQAKKIITRFSKKGEKPL